MYNRFWKLPVYCPGAAHSLCCEQPSLSLPRLHPLLYLARRLCCLHFHLCRQLCIADHRTCPGVKHQTIQVGDGRTNSLHRRSKQEQKESLSPRLSQLYIAQTSLSPWRPLTLDLILNVKDVSRFCIIPVSKYASSLHS